MSSASSVSEPVEVSKVTVARLLVDGSALVEDALPRGDAVVGDERTLAALDALGRRPRLVTVSSTTRRTAQVVLRVRVEHRSPAERDDGRLAERCGHGLALELAEVRLAVALEDVAMAPWPATTTLSVSMNGTPSAAATLRPMRDLPEPIGPMKTTGSSECARHRREVVEVRRDRGEVRLEVAPGLGERVAAELLEHRVREHERDHRLGDDAGGRDRADVGALVVRRSGLARRHVDGAQRVRHRRDRLHAGAHAQHGARGHAALGAAGPVALAVDGAVAHDELVVGLGAAAGRGEESVADLDALDRLDAHEGGSELRVESAVPVHVGAEAGRNAVGEHLDDAAERVAVLVGGVDLGDHEGAGRGVEAAQRVGVERVDVVRMRQRGALGNAHGTDGDGVADEGDAELGEEGAGDGAEGDAGGGLAGAGALEHGPGLVEAVLLHADEVGVAGTRTGERGAATAAERVGVDRLGAHDLGPLRPLGVADAEGDGAAEREAVAHAARDGQLVLLELHAGAAAVAELAAREIGADGVEGDGHAGGQTLEHGDEFGAVRLTGGQPTKHGSIFPQGGTAARPCDVRARRR